MIGKEKAVLWLASVYNGRGFGEGEEAGFI